MSADASCISNKSRSIKVPFPAGVIDFYHFLINTTTKARALQASSRNDETHMIHLIRAYGEFPIDADFIVNRYGFGKKSM